jgi:hypothetical protein
VLFIVYTIGPEHFRQSAHHFRRRGVVVTVARLHDQAVEHPS